MLGVATLALAFNGPAAPLARSARAGTVVAALPELYVYDHCPFCVRVRVAAGVLGVQHKLVFMGNDDIETPTEMVGKKIAPIWKDADGPMMESLDIIEKIDTEKKLAPASGRTDLKAWQKSVQTLMRQLQRPRYVMVPLPEFMQKSGRDAFVNNHQMPPYEKVCDETRAIGIWDLPNACGDLLPPPAAPPLVHPMRLQTTNQITLMA